MSAFFAILAPVLTTLGFAAVLRAASLLEERVMDDPASAKGG